jgi:hypothetical protein
MTYKHKRKCYFVDVYGAGAASALLLCEAYDAHGGRLRGCEFRLLSDSFDKRLSIPSERQATFEEELFVLRTADRVLDGADEDAIKAIVEKELPGTSAVVRSVELPKRS